MITGFTFALESAAPKFGFVGAGVYLVAYSLLQAGILRGQSYTYAFMVIVAATCVAISALGTTSTAVLIMQLFYIIISLFGITRLFVVTHMLRSSPVERAFVRSHLPDLKPEYVRPLMKRGEWIDVESGHVFARQGQPLDHLYFLHDGDAAVDVDGRRVGSCRECFIGELTALTGQAASATVTAEGPCKVLAFDTRRLRRLLRRSPDIKLALMGGFSQATMALLVKRNRDAHGVVSPDQ